MAQEYLTVREAAAMLRMSEAWIRKQIFERKIQFFRIGRRIFLQRAMLEDLIKNGMVEPK